MRPSLTLSCPQLLSHNSGENDDAAQPPTLQPLNGLLDCKSFVGEEEGLDAGHTLPARANGLGGQDEARIQDGIFTRGKYRKVSGKYLPIPGLRDGPHRRMDSSVSWGGQTDGTNALRALPADAMQHVRRTLHTLGGAGLSLIGAGRGVGHEVVNWTTIRVQLGVAGSWRPKN